MSLPLNWGVGVEQAEPRLPRGVLNPAQDRGAVCQGLQLPTALGPGVEPGAQHSMQDLHRWLSGVRLLWGGVEDTAPLMQQHYREQGRGPAQPFSWPLPLSQGPELCDRPKRRGEGFSGTSPRQESFARSCHA